MKITILDQETLCALYCPIAGVEMDAEDLAPLPEEPTEDLKRVTLDVAYLWGAESVDEKLAVISERLMDVSPLQYGRRLYELVMNGCDEMTRTVLAKNAGFTDVDNYIEDLRMTAEQEELRENAQKEGMSVIEYAAMLEARQAADEFETNRRQEIVNEGKSYYEDIMNDFERAKSFAAETSTMYYYQLYVIKHGRSALTQDEILEDQKRETEGLGAPLYCELFADIARIETEELQRVLSSIEEKCGGKNDAFFYELGIYAIENIGYISEEKADLMHKEYLERQALSA